MTTSFKDGLSGNFKPSEYRPKARDLFPPGIRMEVNEWIDFMRIYMDHHFGVVFMTLLKNERYRNVVHTKIKGRIENILTSQESDACTTFLADVDRLPWELGRIRRKRLESILGITTVHKMNMQMALEHLLDEMSESNTDMNFELSDSDCHLIDGDEILLIRALMDLYHNAIFATKAAGAAIITTFLFEEEGYCVIRIQNPIVAPMPESPFSTKVGLRSASYIIETEHQGKLTSGPFHDGSIYMTEIRLPLAGRSEGGIARG